MLILPLCALSLTRVPHYELFTGTVTAEKRPGQGEKLNLPDQATIYKTFFFRKGLLPEAFWLLLVVVHALGAYATKATADM